jgi:malonyl-CoA O-methyltransferase
MAEHVLEKSKVRQAFAAAAQNYDSLAELQRRVGTALLQRFPVEPGKGVLLDVGCGTGFLTHQLVSVFLGRVLALDIAWPMLQTSRQKYPDMHVQYVCADAENLPFASHSVEQLFSNLALQWAEDLSATLLDFMRILMPGGQLVFATFGPQTLHELKSAWSVVDDYVHVNSFHTAGQIAAFLEQAGFVDVSIDSVLYLSEYSSVEALMRELKGIGAHNVNRQRNHKPTTRSQLRSMINSYQQQMAGESIVATYEILFVQAKVPK